MTEAVTVETTREWLLTQGEGNDSFDRQILASALAAAAADHRPLAEGLGLSALALTVLLEHYFPHAALPPITAGGEIPKALEESDLRVLLIEHRAGRDAVEVWLAHIIARRSLAPNHLWQDLGLPSRAMLGDVMRRHFPTLADANSKGMRWKKFFYRELCQREGIPICKSPNCETCSDVAMCFAPET